MSFPATNLNIFVEIALGADPADPSTWSWTDVTSYCYIRQPIQITHGGYDGSVEIPPSTISLTVDNRDGRWCEYNPTGAWFGQLSRGTPLRVRVNEGSNSVRMTGNIASLPPKWDITGSDKYVPITVAGVTRRMQRGTTPLRSATTKTLAGYAPIAYWPAEDSSSATSFAEYLGGAAGTWTGTLTPGSSGPDGSAPLPLLTATTGIRCQTRVVTSATAWTAAMVINVPSPVVARTTIMQVHTSGTLPMWQLVLDLGTPDTITLEAYDSTNTIQATSSTTFDSSGVELYDDWVLLIISATQNGANVDWSAWFLNADSHGGGLSGSVAATAGAAYDVVVPFAASLDGAYAGHFVLYGDDVNLDLVAVVAMLKGYSGESPYARIARGGGFVSDPTSVDVEFALFPTTTQTMGPQPIATLLSIYREAEAVDGGRLFDNRDPTAFNAPLRMVQTGDIVNSSVAWTINHASTPVAFPFEPTSDDQNLRNDWTAYRPSGSSQRRTATTGNLTPALVGTYDDSVTVNVEKDEDLGDQAQWRAAVGTVEGLRFPTINLDFARNPSLIASWIACEIGTRINITNPPSGIPPDTIDGIIEGWTETLSSRSWKVTLNCSPYKPFAVGTLASTSGDTSDILGWLDWDGCEMAATATSGATSLTISALPTDTTDSDDFPRQAYVAGELVTTTACAAALTDSFTRSTSNGWGSATTGQAWTNTGTNSDFSVSGTEGLMLHGAANTLKGCNIPVGVGDMQTTVSLRMSTASATTASLTQWSCVRYVDLSNFYAARMSLTTSGTITLSLLKMVAGTITTLVSAATIGINHASGHYWKLVTSVQDVNINGATFTTLNARAWNSTAGFSDPILWAMSSTTAEDTALTAGTKAALLSRREITNADAAFSFQFDNFSVDSLRTWTVTRSVNGVTKAHVVGDQITLAKPLILSL